MDKSLKGIGRLTTMLQVRMQKRKGKERKGKVRKGKARTGKERKGKERKGKDMNGKERKVTERKPAPERNIFFKFICSCKCCFLFFVYVKRKQITQNWRMFDACSMHSCSAHAFMHTLFAQRAYSLSKFVCSHFSAKGKPPDQHPKQTEDARGAVAECDKSGGV